jgi:hypothetical protein
LWRRKFEIQSKIEAKLTALYQHMLVFQALTSRRFQRGFHRVNQHRPTWSNGNAGQDWPASSTVASLIIASL